MNLQKIYMKSPVFVQQWLTTMWGYNEHKNRFVGAHDPQLKWLKENISMSRERFFEVERELLPKIIEHAYRTVPAYKKKFDDTGVNPEDIKSRDDLLKLPYVTKEEVKADYDRFISSDYDRKDLLVHYTSGSTGSPTAVYRSREFFQKYYAYISFFREEMGIRLNSPRISFGGKVVVPSDQKKPPFWRVNPAWNQLYMSSYHLTLPNMPSYIEKIRKHKPEEVVGYTSAITVLAKYIVENGITDIRPKVVFSNSEPLRDYQRVILEQAFQCPVREWYSTIEHLFFAAQCEHGNYHFYPGLGIVEILNDGKPAKDGEPGEVYGTTLLNFASPLIRYRIMDSVVQGGNSCRCGSNLPFATTIIGKIDDLIATPDGNFLGMSCLVFQSVPDLREGQIIQEDYENFIAYLAPGAKWDESSEKAFRDKFRVMYPYKANLKIEVVDSVPRRGTCKAPNVISKINRDNEMIRKTGFKNVKIAKDDDEPEK